MSGRDPIWLLLPVIGSGAVANYWPGFELFMNVTVTVIAVVAALWVIVRVGWLWLGPLPQNVKLSKSSIPEANLRASVPDA